MPVHAACAALCAAADEAHVAGAAAPACARHQPRGARRAHTACAPAYDRAERAAGAAAAYSTDPGTQHIPNGCLGGRTAPALPSFRRSASSFVLGLHAKPPESDAVAGLQEESVVGNLLGRHLGRVTQSHHRHAVDGFGVGDDPSYAYPGVDRKAGRATSHNNAIREKYTSSKARTTDGDSSCCAATCRQLCRAAASAIVRELDTA